MRKILGPLFGVVVLMVAQAGASVVTSIPGGTVIPMPALNYFGPGAQTFGPGVTWSSSNINTQGGSVFGYTGASAFGTNGTWVGALGGFLNYYPDGITTPTVIAVWDSGGNLIESFNLTFLTGGGTNTGSFYGFQESTANISYFTLTDNYAAIVNLTTGSSSSVPEPGSLVLICTGLLGVIGYGRRRLGL